jgi:hypothetical protein
VADVLYQTSPVVKIKALDYDDNELRYRWNSSFKLDESQIAQASAGDCAVTSCFVYRASKTPIA